MSLKNVAKNIIGNLKAIDIVLLVSLSDPMRFPMDSIFNELILREGGVFNEMIDLVSEICQMESVHDELYSVIDDIITSPLAGYYTEETITLLLNLYINNPNIKTFNYQNTAAFHDELRHVFDAVIMDLFDSLMSGRIAYHDTYPGTTIHPLKPLILQLLTLIYDITPKNIIMLTPEYLLLRLTDDWVKLRDNLAETASVHDESEGYIRVVQELK